MTEEDNEKKPSVQCFITKLGDQKKQDVEQYRAQKKKREREVGES